MKLKRVVLLTVLLFFYGYGAVYGIKGYSVSIEAHGGAGIHLKMGYHLGSNQYLKDSTTTDLNGRCRFYGRETLPRGVYFIVLPDSTFFEFLIDKDQKFSISFDMSDPVATLVYTGSELNSGFTAYQRRWKKMQEEIIELNSILRKTTPGSEKALEIKKSVSEKESDMIAYLKKVAADNRGTLLEAITRSLLPVEVPPPPVPENVSNPDSVRHLYSAITYKDHFFDNISFSEPGLIRSPVLAGRLDQFFRQVVIPLPDSVIKECGIILKRCEQNKEVYQYVSTWLFNRYVRSDIMGHDAVVVYLADEVYLSGRAAWVSKEFVDDLSKKIEKLRPSLIGKKAVNLVMDSFAGSYVSLYDVTADITILYFWEPDCGHCKEATPLLKAYYDTHKNKSIEVFAVCTQADRSKWEKYIRENELDWINAWDPMRISRFDYYYNVESTPMVYILDRDKKIIAKKLPVEKVGLFIEEYRRSGAY